MLLLLRGRNLTESHFWSFVKPAIELHKSPFLAREVFNYQDGGERFQEVVSNLQEYIRYIILLNH